MLVASALYLAFAVVSLHGIPFLLGGDAQFFSANALRMFNGDLVYRDFLEFTPPGTDLIYWAAFELLGPRIWAPNLVVLVLGLSLGWLCFHVARQLMRPGLALLATALFLIQDYGKWLDATHHWFSLLAALLAVAVLMRTRTPTRTLVSGALLGAASYFSQTRGVSAALGVAAFLVWDRYRTQAPWRVCLWQWTRLVVSFVASWVVLSGYFLLKVGTATVLYFQTLYVLRYVTSEQSVAHHAETDVLHWPPYYAVLYCAIPLICVLAVWRSHRRTPSSSGASMLLACVGGAMFIEVALSPNPLRVDAIALPSMVLLVWLLSAVDAPLMRYATPILLLGLLLLGAHRIADRNARSSQEEDLPAGRVVMPPATGEKLAWIAQHTVAGEEFFQANYVNLYLPLGLRSPAYAPLSRQTPAYVDVDIRQLESKRVRYILWSRYDEPRYPRFEQFLNEHYQPVWTFADRDEIWERKR